MSKVKIEKLKLHLWQEILYLLLVMVAPIVVAAVEIFSSDSTAFKITFSSLGTVLIAVIIIRKFVFKTYIDKLKGKCLMTEHDYEVDVGDKSKLRKTWAIYNIIIFGYNVIVVLLAMILSVLFISALADQLLAFKGAAIIIFVFCLSGLLLKLIFFAIMTRSKEEDNGGES